MQADLKRFSLLTVKNLSISIEIYHFYEFSDSPKILQIRAFAPLIIERSVMASIQSAFYWLKCKYLVQSIREGLVRDIFLPFRAGLLSIDIGVFITSDQNLILLS